MADDLNDRKLNELFPLGNPDDNLPSNKIDVPFEEDIHLARESIKDTLHEAGKAAAELADLAFSSQAPRFYEVYNNTLKTKLEAAKDLISLHKSRKDITRTSVEHQKGPTEIHHQQNLIMTTANMIELIKQQLTEEPKDITPNDSTKQN